MVFIITAAAALTGTPRRAGTILDTSVFRRAGGRQSDTMAGSHPIPALLNNRYELQEPLGSGGMAEVRRAHDRLLDRSVAVKILREEFTREPEARNRFLREAQSLAKLSHPNLVAVFDFGVEDTRCYMVLERIEGEDLKSLLRRAKDLPLERKLDIAVQACEGLGLAHRAGLVHCDVKPQNILLTADLRAKVADFGIARAAARPADPENVEEVVWGSPAYLSPEQAAGGALTPASDVYSTGVMLFEMLAGRLPFLGKDPQALALRHQTEKPPSLRRINPEVSPELEQIVMRAMSKRPAERFRNGDQMARVLKAYLAESAGQDLESEAEDGGVDWLAVGLSFLALVAVGGLIPLWVYVYFLYNPLLP